MKTPAKPTSRRIAYPLATWSRPVRDMWLRYTSQYVVDDEYGRHLLATACEAYGEMESARELIEKHGLLVTDRHGQLHPNPAAAIARGARFAMLSALHRLNFDLLPQGKPGRPPTRG